ncbi:MAG: RsmE family RNA methyltransferase [Candidatus Ornithospirochaeta sp.]|nr:RsmE family RNA methyltransferase [Candidatus Ornithospirochaeta sp.]
MNIVLFREGESSLPLSDPRCQHILKVLGMKEGDSFKAGFANGMMGMARIESIGDSMSFSFDFREDGSYLHPLTAIIALVRPICMKRILREAVSLGVSRLILPVSDLGEKSYLKSSLFSSGEYESILIDGAMQSGRTGVPDVVIASSVSDAIDRLGDASDRYLLDNAIGSVPLSTLDLAGRRPVIAIGPERGWTERERNVFLSRGFKPCLLGDRILRTETAAVGGITLTLARMGCI